MSGKAGSPASNAYDLNRESKLQRALAPENPVPLRRKLRIYASDPTMASMLDTYSRNTTVTDVPWEPLEPGPIGEYLEVIDVDPASGAVYAPVALDDGVLLHEHGLPPSETDPRFHQQMVYAVASRTIEVFERALGRRALWAPNLVEPDLGVERKGQAAGSAPSVDPYVQRLRIYPHAVRAANAYYSPAKKALLLGYFSAVPDDRDGSGARTSVFAALSHDIIAHETAHALLDGLHRRFIEATNPDMLAFHEAFADIVAMFLHFTLPDAVRPEIAATRGDLFAQNRLGQIAFQFGQSLGQRGALRDYIGEFGPDGIWVRRPPQLDDYAKATEPHARGAVMVAAVFDAFLQIYQVKARGLFRIATGGTGEIEPGELAPALVDALAEAACEIAGRFLNIIIRALDYCPPFDLNFGEFLRAIITADRDLVPADPHGYRVAITQAFRARGISPRDVRSVSPDTLAWETPDRAIMFDTIMTAMDIDWRPGTPRDKIFKKSQGNAAIFARWLTRAPADARTATVGGATDTDLQLFGITRGAGPLTLRMKIGDEDADEQLVPGRTDAPVVHSVRTLRRVGPDGTIHADLIVEITQSWEPGAVPGQDAARMPPGFRGGCTLIIDRATGRLRYVIRKRIDSHYRYDRQAAFLRDAPPGLHATYFADGAATGEPFAILHSGILA